MVDSVTYSAVISFSRASLISIRSMSSLQFWNPLVNSYSRTYCKRTSAGIFTGSEPWSVVNAGIYSGGTGAVPVIAFEEKLQLNTYCTYPFLTSR